MPPAWPRNNPPTWRSVLSDSMNKGSDTRGRIVRIGGYRQSWRVTNATELIAALAWRDEKGGALFWITPDDQQYPSLAIRVTKDYADVHYFPSDGHPGFRSLGGEGLPEGG